MGLQRIGHDLATEQQGKSRQAKDVITEMIPWWGFPGGSDGKESACNVGDLSLIPGSGRSPGEGNGYPFQYSCLENSTDRGVWQATVYGVAKSRTQLSPQVCVQKMIIYMHTFYKSISIYLHTHTHTQTHMTHNTRHTESQICNMPSTLLSILHVLSNLILIITLWMYYHTCLIDEGTEA